MIRQIYLFFFGFLLISGTSHAQLNASTIGSAQDLGGNCFLITPDQLDQAGGVWYDNPIDFSEDFSIYYKNNFGNKDNNGADGMALVFKATSTPDVGGIGGGMGYQGISPSLIVEFDTYWNNADNNDPFDDHIAIVSNGNPVHTAATNLAGPVPPTSTTINMEDGVDHNVKIVWTAATQTFEVFFDCELRLTLNQDVKNTIFGGDSTVFFGFVGSTGGLSNLHQVCFNRISFVDNLVLQPETICSGESVQVDAEIPSGDTYTWTPSAGVSNVNVANPTLTPTTTTTYTVTIEDECGDAITEDIEIIVLPVGSAIFDPIPAICEGDPNPLPATDLNGVTGTWTPAFNANTTTDYTFTPDAGQCAATPAPIQLVVNPLVTPIIPTLNPICEGDPNPLPNTIDGITGTWTPAFNANTTTDYTFTPDAGQCATTPAPVQLVVNPLVTPTFTAVSPICSGDTIAPLPTTSNNGITGTWDPATIDNTTTTIYTFTPNSGTCVVETTLEITVLPQVTPTFSIDDICIGETIGALPTFSLEGITGTWSPAVNNLATTTYTFTPDPGQCANATTETVEVNPINTLAVSTENTSEPFDSNQIIEVTVSGGSGNYEYQLDGGSWQTNSIFQNVVGCQEHTIKVRDAEGCSNEPESVVTILSYPKFFTPNGDGFNDFWNIKCLRNRTGLVTIFDRFGKLLKQFKTSNAGWNGVYNNALMPTSDYWFLVTYYDENGNEKEFRSHFTLRR